MQALKNSEVESLGNELGMSVLIPYKELPIDSLKFNSSYQRALETPRWKRISESIKHTGYWPQEVVILNELHEIIDGQHRVVAAKKNGIRAVPVSVVTFPSKQKEAEFFARKNNWNTSLKPVDFWYARYLSGHPFACLIYRLVEDKASKLCGMVAIKGHETNKSKFYLGDALVMVNGCALGILHTWNKENDKRSTERIISTTYEKIRDSVNDFLGFFYGCFGDDKRSNPIPYKSHCIRPEVIFYALLRDAGHLNSEPKKQAAINKMKSYVFTADFSKMDHSSKVIALVSHFNHKRKTDRIVYDPSNQ